MVSAPTPFREELGQLLSGCPALRRWSDEEAEVVRRGRGSDPARRRRYPVNNAKIYTIM